MKTVLVVLGVSVLLGACALGLIPAGTLIVSIAADEQLAARTIEPPGGIEVRFFSISGTGPGERSFSELALPGSTEVQVESLIRGEWQVAVAAIDRSGTVLGSGSTTVDVKAGDVATATVPVTVRKGNGWLRVIVEWMGLTEPRIEAALSRLGGAGEPMDFVILDDAGELQTSLLFGHYLLALRLFDGPQVIWGYVEDVHIAAEQLSERTYRLSTGPGYEGLRLIGLPSPEDQVAIAFEGASEKLTQYGASMTVTARSAEAVAGYQWYLQGGALGGEAAETVTVNSDLRPGNYTLSLVIATDSGPSVGHVSFEVVASDAGITVEPYAGISTTEIGGQDTFTVVLDSAPNDEVVVPLSVDTPDEALLDTSSVIFTPENWNEPQTVTVSGLADDEIDGSQAYAIVTEPAESSDPAYNGYDARDVFAVNRDSDEAHTGDIIPVTDPPKPLDGCFYDDGNPVTRSGGRTYRWVFTTGLDNVPFLAWGVSNLVPPELSFDGLLDSRSETLQYDAAVSDLPNGILRYTGAARIRYLYFLAIDSLPEAWWELEVDTRLTVTIRTSLGAPLPLVPASDYPSLPPEIGAVALVTDHFNVNAILEARLPSPFPVNASPLGSPGDFVPALDLFDTLQTDPLYTGMVVSSFVGGFYSQ